ncbi:MAG: hypothetical protein KC496_09790, partial [Anaerolineae bacterium]|nr:hypothetical protein [Anaerolineae bacterium]
MSRDKTRYSIICVVLLLLFAAGSQGQEAGDSLPYGTRGAYPVGTRDFVIEGDTSLDITVWYPANNEAEVEESVSYPYMTNPDSSMGMEPMVHGQAIREAPYAL